MTMHRVFAASRVLTIAVVALAPLATGCASRAIPFDALDKAQVTILKIQAPAPAPVLPGPVGAVANPVGPILQSMGLPADVAQPVVDMAKQMGLPAIPGIPGLPVPGAGPAPGQPSLPMFRNQWQVVDQRPIMDEALRSQLLDVFGSADSFNAQPVRCWTPGLAVSFADPSKPEPVDVVISLSCGAANGFGFAWPHGQNYSLQPGAHQTLSQIYTSLFGPVPPQGV